LLIRVRLPLFVLAVLVLQQTVMVGLKVHGAHPDVVLLLPIAAGLVAGPQMGAAVGFCVGFIYDLLLNTPFGLSAFTYGFVGLALGMLQTSVSRSAWWLAPFAAAVASAAGTLLYAAIGALVGQSQMLHHNLVWIIVVVAAVNCALAGPAVRVMEWAFPKRTRVPSL
ncbi:MAG: rod shape-determining protein MreD, partial [Candidatus Dormibacteria bacterium]